MGAHHSRHFSFSSLIPDGAGTGADHHGNVWTRLMPLGLFSTFYALKTKDRNGFYPSAPCWQLASDTRPATRPQLHPPSIQQPAHQQLIHTAPPTIHPSNNQPIHTCHQQLIHTAPPTIHPSNNQPIHTCHQQLIHTAPPTIHPSNNQPIHTCHQHLIHPSTQPHLLSIHPTTSPSTPAIQQLIHTAPPTIHPSNNQPIHPSTPAIQQLIHPSTQPHLLSIHPSNNQFIHPSPLPAAV